LGNEIAPSGAGATVTASLPINALIDRIGANLERSTTTLQRIQANFVRINANLDRMQADLNEIRNLLLLHLDTFRLYLPVDPR